MTSTEDCFRLVSNTLSTLLEIPGDEWIFLTKFENDYTYSVDGHRLVFYCDDNQIISLEEIEYPDGTVYNPHDWCSDSTDLANPIDALSPLQDSELTANMLSSLRMTN